MGHDEAFRVLMRLNTQINPNLQVYNPAAGMERLQAQAPKLYGGVNQQHFADLYRPMGQQAATELGRGNTQAAGQYFSKASDAATQSALAGLNLLSEQESNAMQRNQAAQKIAYGWMNDMFSGANKILGGLL